jgi:CHAD domain-containing protein
VPDKNKIETPRHRRAVPENRISRSASIEAELERIAAAEIDYALDQIRAAAKRPDSAVHQCRKAIKRLRALVRLAGGDDADAGREIDRRLRDAGRLLAAARDADVVRMTAARLCADSAHSKRIDLGGGSAAARPDREVRRRVRNLLREARDLFAGHIGGRRRTPGALGAPVERAGVKATRLMSRFRERGGPKLAHDWRKSVQRYANQLKLMADVWPELAAAELGSLDALAECLGELNDLTILRAALEAGQIGADVQSRAALRKLARARQRTLRKRALELGESLFHRQDARSPPVSAEPDEDPRWL